MIIVRENNFCAKNQFLGGKIVMSCKKVMSPTRAIRRLGNALGLAWWAKIETKNPEVTYWFGPFMTRRSLNGKLPTFLEDLTREGAEPLNHTLIRCRKSEPLTI